MINNVFVVRFYTTGEQWHMAVCETQAAAKSVCAGYGITMTAAGGTLNTDGHFWEILENPRDNSQTASIHELPLIKERVR